MASRLCIPGAARVADETRRSERHELRSQPMCDIAVALDASRGKQPSLIWHPAPAYSMFTR
jgi:hypothetical protein